jgi:hypothetical protein
MAEAPVLRDEAVDKAMPHPIPGASGTGFSDGDARPVAGSRRGSWDMSNMKPVEVAMPNHFFAERGLLSLLNRYEALAQIT